MECGATALIVLVDSIARMIQAFNLAGREAGRTMSGGVDARWRSPGVSSGWRRNIEHGGSVTVIATTLVETGARAWTILIYESSRTGNSEVVLDRSHSRSIFPAISVRPAAWQDELLYGEDDYRRLVTLRRWLAGDRPKPRSTACSS
ncbi:MAG: hypothetical protein R2838_16045 [Caldilineaceae bacterium]